MLIWISAIFAGAVYAALPFMVRRTWRAPRGLGYSGWLGFGGAIVAMLRDCDGAGWGFFAGIVVAVFAVRARNRHAARIAANEGVLRAESVKTPQEADTR